MKFNEAIKREIIMDNYQYPAHHGLKDDDTYLEKHMASESCIDDIHLQLKVEDGRVVDGNFDGEACAISTSSTSIILKLVIGKTIDEANHIIDEYIKMLDGQEYDEELLEEANAFNSLFKQANRIKCGLIGVEGIKTLIEESESSNEK